MPQIIQYTNKYPVMSYQGGGISALKSINYAIVSTRLYMQSRILSCQET